MDDTTRTRQAGAEPPDLAAPGAAECGFCDCEIFLDGWTPCDELCIPDEDGELDRPPTPPACAGSAGSQPCGNWVPRRRDRW
jgi:hypothetical protein